MPVVIEKRVARLPQAPTTENPLTGVSAGQGVLAMWSLGESNP